jgi:hypothetical protein
MSAIRLVDGACAGLARLMVVLDLMVMNIALPIGSAGAGFHHGRPAAGGHRSYRRQLGSH